MGQKNHPLGLRIQSSTRTFDSSWYSDHFFTKLISIDLVLSLYLHTFFKLLQLPFARFSTHHYPKMTQLYTFFCYPRQSREYKSKIFQISSGITSLSLKKNKNYPKNQANNLRKQQLLIKNSIKDGILWQNLVKSAVFPFVKKNREIVNQRDLITRFTLHNNNEKWLISQFSQNFLKNKSKVLPETTNYNNYFEEGNKITSLNVNGYTKRIVKQVLLKGFDNACLKSRNIYLTNNRELFQKILFNEFNNFDLFFTNTKQFIINLYMILNNKINIIRNKDRVEVKIAHKSTRTYGLCDEVIKMTPSNRSGIINLQPKSSDLVGINVNQLKYQHHLQDSISQHFKFNLKFIPFKVNSEWQDAGYFADEIVYLLERRIPFRRLKNRILKQLILNSNIRGLRLICSGRVGGKSKKAQRAKMDSMKYGQNSLHIFSAKIDFAVRTAYTPLGSTGIKVWICYN
jgi:ribosomal protein S3